MKKNSTSGNRRVLIAAVVSLVVLVGLPLALSLLDKKAKDTMTKAAEPVPAAKPQTPKQVTAPPPAEAAPVRLEAEEIHYLPGQVGLNAGAGSPLLKKTDMKEGNRRITGIRKVTDKSKNGEFLSAKWSPDGLQMIASRPGYRGLYVIDARTGLSRQIADGGAFGAKWTTDGKIEVRDEDGNIRTLNPDGTVDSVGPDTRSQQAYAENDTVYVKTTDGGSVPITTSDDKYFNPVVSPDGKSVVYQGLTTGLYMANADGSGEPVYLGSGNNVVWAPDSSGIVFDVTTDDGHMLTSGDLYFVDADGSTRTNLTPGSDSIDEMPSVSPDGHQVVYQSDGEIYVGELR
ncbi:PD40 domain-containing protein [Candidatus Sumerlaeota bacterium]|nr:PD40 domain-containing protein [Candidatus Sumerlaeota bacterium]